METMISVITPFYRGNAFIETLLSSVSKVKEVLPEKWRIESIIINDSPDEYVEIKSEYDFPIHIFNNEQNVGIQQTRVNGLKKASGNWIIFLDQDDELHPEGFRKQISLAQNADMVVGNCFYEYPDFNSVIYKNERVMRYYMRKDMFIKIRNLIPSPGECLIKRECIPSLWIDEPMRINGADDWLLWLLLFNKNIRIAVNDKIVYMHHFIGGTNLSLDLKKMYLSCIEMYEILKRNNCLSGDELKTLRGVIEYKYIRDTSKCRFFVDLRYFRCFINNIIYKLATKIL